MFMKLFASPMVARAAAAATLLASTGLACGQQFTNGDFETGDLTGWTVTPTPNGSTLVQLAEVVDIDGEGPLLPSYAGKFQVGLQVYVPEQAGGVDVVQPLELSGGVEYTISFNWAAMRTGAGPNGEGGVFALIVNGAVVGQPQAAGETSPELPRYGFLQQSFTPSTSGQYQVCVRITRPFLVAGLLYQFVDNLEIQGGGACYANCDGSTTPPILNVEDFTCFINRFAEAQSLPHEQQLTHYANCDQSTTPPVLNVEDFTCFINKFAQGCP
jgi:hypothetical protein